MRHRLELEKQHTCTVGISTSKTLSKLVGNVHKPNSQTTLLPPYISEDGNDNVTSFIDSHEVGKIPGIGFKIAQKLRALVLQRPADFDSGLVYGGTKESVLVGDVRKHPNIGPDTLEKLLGGPGTPHGIGLKIWALLNGCDDSEVGPARDVPTQISLEDSYLRLDTMTDVKKELLMLSKSLLKRMHVDLLEDDEDADLSTDQSGDVAEPSSTKRWTAFPKTLRLTTRPRPPPNPDGSRNRSFARISRSGPMPNFVFRLKDSVDGLAERLVNEALLPLFRKLHPEKSGWNLSLINVAATNMVDAATEKGVGGVGRDIGRMFKRQDEVLKDFRVTEIDDAAPTESIRSEWTDSVLHTEKTAAPVVTARGFESNRGGSEDIPTPSQEAAFATHDAWESEDEDMVSDEAYRCSDCGAVMPIFAMGAHARWHAES